MHWWICSSPAQMWLYKHKCGGEVLRVCDLPWQGEWCWFYPLPQNFSVFITLFSLPQRTFLCCLSCRRGTGSCIYRCDSKESPCDKSLCDQTMLLSFPVHLWALWGTQRNPGCSRKMQLIQTSPPAFPPRGFRNTKTFLGRVWAGSAAVWRFVSCLCGPCRSGTWRPCAAPRTSACARSATPWRWWSPAWTRSSRTNSSPSWVGAGLSEQQEKFINNVAIHWETWFYWEPDSFHAVVLNKFAAGQKLPRAAKLLVNKGVTVISSKFDITWFYSVKSSYVITWKTFPSSWKLLSTFASFLLVKKCIFVIWKVWKYIFVIDSF